MEIDAWDVGADITSNQRRDGGAQGWWPAIVTFVPAGSCIHQRQIDVGTGFDTGSVA